MGREFVQDLKYASRIFLRNPALTSMALIAITLGVGATTAVFSVLDRVLFRDLPYHESSRLG
jgi:hypothetical protein